VDARGNPRIKSGDGHNAEGRLNPTEIRQMRRILR
jgi:hypothetical protein